MSETDDDPGRPICQCECGGQVFGVEQFGRLWTWCDRCTPIVKVTLKRSMLGEPRESIPEPREE